MRADAEALAAHCLDLEAHGVTPTWQNVTSR